MTTAVKESRSATLAPVSDALDARLFGLDDSNKDDVALCHCLNAIADACAQIAVVLRDRGGAEKTSTRNPFGDEQLEIDVLADRIMFDRLRSSGVVRVASSEEDPTEVELSGDDATRRDGFSVAFDPLDGSSVIDSNFSVGTIFGVWPGRGLLGRSGREQLAAGCAVYGPRTTLALSVRSSAPFELQLDYSSPSSSSPSSGRGGGGGASVSPWRRTKEFAAMAAAGKLFAPGNLRAAQSLDGYAALVRHWHEQRYTLRYTGAMVPDVYQLLVKAKGVFCNPAAGDAPAKLRLLYECAPLSYLIESAGGRSSDGRRSVLDRQVDSLDRRVQICLGSADEVGRFESVVGEPQPSSSPS